MAESGKNETGDVAFIGLEEGQLSAFKGDDQIPLAKLNAVFRRDGVNMRRVQAQSVEGSENLARRRIGGGPGRSCQKEKNKQDGTNAHLQSVVTFGMDGQGASEPIALVE